MKENELEATIIEGSDSVTVILRNKTGRSLEAHKFAIKNLIENLKIVEEIAKTLETIHEKYGISYEEMGNSVEEQQYPNIKNFLALAEWLEKKIGPKPEVERLKELSYQRMEKRAEVLKYSL